MFFSHNKSASAGLSVAETISQSWLCLDRDVSDELVIAVCRNHQPNNRPVRWLVSGLISPAGAGLL